MELAGEELETFNRLRQKYSSLQENSNGMPADPNAPGAESWQPTQLIPVGGAPAGTVSHAKGASLDARMCAICQGLGVEVELYEHRRLERQCTACGGRGVVVYRDGVEVKDEPHSQQQHQGTEGAAQQGGGVHEAPWADMTDDEAGKVQEDIRAIGAKQAQYQQELSQAQAALDQSADAEERRLREGLVAQLGAHVKKLRGALLRKEAQLRLAGRL